MHCRVGEWKVITNFTLSPAYGLYRHTNHVYKMDFGSQTTITDSDNLCDNMFLELHDFANITNGSHDTSLLIDVIGEVLDFGDLDVVQGERKEVTKLVFNLRDIKFHTDDNSLEMYQELNGKIVIPEKRLKWSQIPFQTVQEMKHTEKDGKCRVISTVYAIDTENGWYYFACVVCNNKVQVGVACAGSDWGV
ncbi:hypothetical protein IGI04_029623 [Brassica rapa subsp. trilocularis]|uniref:Replication protein A 70 kDa DNA-binding subunit B/D first OB fold domain-containing protein n=1 Tax=Brassica rapa subsp. trilocularis TaxID=1813537 RepID=A0ABQ7LND0_BRACM|nr:hypothetical protein IGI04_029623 [Brassica rapa subsp. trilocularis]